jgi:hypothetical protein
MKKLLITVLAIFYLGVSSGATLHFHYCMGELIEWGLSNDLSEKSSECSNCGMKKGVSEDCCKDQKQEYKLKESQKTPVIIVQPNVFALATPNIPDFTQIILSTPANLNPERNAPPRTLKTAVFIRNCNFRI